MIEKNEEHVERSEQEEYNANEGAKTNDLAEIDGSTEASPTKELKLYKKQIAIVGIIFVAVIVILFACLYESEFEKVHNECVNIAGVVFEPSDDSFTIDTYSESVPIPNAQSRALEAIQYANKELGFSDSLYSRMIKTTLLMGRQSEENDNYRVSWTFSPYDGLEVTYERK